MSEPSAEQFGGVLAVPPKPRRIMVAAAAVSAVLAAAAVIIVVAGPNHARPHPAKPPANLIATLSDHGGRGATSAAFSPDGKTLAILDADGTTYLWDVAARRWAGSLSSLQCKGGDAQVLFSPDGMTLAVVGSAGGGNTCLWDVAARRQVAVLNNGPGSTSLCGVTSGAFSPSGAMLAIGDCNGQIYLWNVATAQQVATLTDPSQGGGSTPDVVGVAFGPGGTTLAAADDDAISGDAGSTFIWDISARRVIDTLTDPVGPYWQQTGGPESVAFSQDGTVAVGDGEVQVCLFDAATGQEIAAVAPRINAVESNSLYDSNADVSGLLEANQGPVGVTVALSQDGGVLAAGVDYGYGVEVWSGAGTPTHLIASLTDPGGDKSQAPQLALNPDGTMLAVVDHNGRTYLWRTG
jgi:WD40 repeat protein